MGALILLLQLFKIILFIALSLLILFILITIIVLVTPIDYAISVKKYSNTMKEANSSFLSPYTVKVRVTWLFKIFKVRYLDKDSKKMLSIKIFGIDTSKWRKDKTEKKVNNKVKHKKNVKKKPIKKEIKGKKEGKEKTSIINKLKDILNNIKFIYNYEDREKIIKSCITLFKRIIKALKPSKFSLKGKVGFKSPDITGYVIGLQSIIVSLTNLDIVISGDFENEDIEFHLSIKGKLFIYLFLIALIKFVFYKPIWKIIKKYFFKKGDFNE